MRTGGLRNRATEEQPANKRKIKRQIKTVITLVMLCMPCIVPFVSEKLTDSLPDFKRSDKPAGRTRQYNSKHQLESVRTCSRYQSSSTLSSSITSFCGPLENKTEAIELRKILNLRDAPKADCRVSGGGLEIELLISKMLTSKF